MLNDSNETSNHHGQLGKHDERKSNNSHSNCFLVSEWIKDSTKEDDPDADQGDVGVEEATEEGKDDQIRPVLNVIVDNSLSRVDSVPVFQAACFRIPTLTLIRVSQCIDTRFSTKSGLVELFVFF